MSDDSQELTVTVQLSNSDEPFGAVTNDKMVIEKLTPCSPAAAKLAIGDRILEVNNSTVKDAHQLHDLLISSRPQATLLVSRDKKMAEEMNALKEIPPRRAKHIKRKDGFIHLLVRMEWKTGGVKLGLGIKEYDKRVLVSRCDDGSLSASHLQVGDCLLDVESRVVTDKEDCRRAIVKNIAKRRAVTLLVERPESAEARRWVKCALEAPSEMPSIPLASDVREIAAKQRKRYLEQPAIPGKGIVRAKETDQAAESPQRAKISEGKPKVFVIAADHEGEALRHVRKQNEPPKEPIFDTE